MNETTPIPLDRSTTPERIAVSLRQQIARGELAPGTRLHEVQFTKAYGVSRHTLREAISILVSEGLLTRNSYKGVEVTRMTPADIRDVFAARRGIELSAVDALAGASTEVIADLLAAIEQASARADMADSGAMDTADTAVHMALVAVHGSRRLSLVFSNLFRELHILLFNAYGREKLARTAKAHKIFGQLVRAGDLQSARLQLEQRLNRTEDEMVRLCQEDRRQASRDPGKSKNNGRGNSSLMKPPEVDRKTI